MKILSAHTKASWVRSRFWQSEQTGDRYYREGEVFQSQSSASGEKLLPIRKDDGSVLKRRKQCPASRMWRGNLATMLARRGKSVTVVYDNLVSFDLAKRFFGLPKEIPCFVADFKEYLSLETRSFDAIAIDLGGPGFCSAGAVRPGNLSFDHDTAET